MVEAEERKYVVLLIHWLGSPLFVPILVPSSPVDPKPVLIFGRIPLILISSSAAAIKSPLLLDSARFFRSGGPRLVKDGIQKTNGVPDEVEGEHVEGGCGCRSQTSRRIYSIRRRGCRWGLQRVAIPKSPVQRERDEAGKPRSASVTLQPPVG